MSNPTPPPVTPGSNCPNCGAFRPAGQTYCANCGYGRPAVATPSGGNYMVLWIVLFIIVGLPAGCLGGCFLVAGGAGGSGSSDTIGLMLLGLAGLAVFVLLLSAIIISARRKK